MGAYEPPCPFPPLSTESELLGGAYAVCCRESREGLEECTAFCEVEDACLEWLMRDAQESLVSCSEPGG
eukprot:scaffold99895_cov14-Tisochrysis_lutea.AAC.1